MLHIKSKGGKFMNICIARRMDKIRPISVRISANFVFNGISASKIEYFSKVSR